MSSQEQTFSRTYNVHIITLLPLLDIVQQFHKQHLSCPMIHLSQEVTHSGSDETKKVYGKALTKLVKKVKYLEDKLKSTSVRRKARMVISNDEEDLVSEYPSKQGRITETKFEDITPTKVSQGEEQSQESSEVQLDVLSAAKILADASRERVKTYKSYTRRRKEEVIVSSRDSTAGGLFSTAEEILSSDERIAHKLNKEEMAKAVAREEQEMIDFEKALELQKIVR
ncbi:hypothetical protein Tco_0768152 [Tanacetum coccineum]